MARRALTLPAALVLCWFSLASSVPAVTLTLAPSSSSGYRWLNVADQAYEAAYRTSYTYSQPTVQVQFTYNPSAAVFGGILTATNLKPNFAYQLKLSGTPGTPSNERIGLAGRWWEETWNGVAWASGTNLNHKGDGSSPNQNDLDYFALRDVPDPTNTSPTGRLYRFTGYLLFDYFITDDSGGVSLTTQQDSSFHVLYNTLQGEYTHGPNDGPLKSSTFDPDPASPAYDTNYGSTTRTIYGEWERLPMGGVFLANGSYSAQLVLTEESFHGSVSQGAGTWAQAMDGTVAFAIVPEPGTMALFAAGFAALLCRSRRRRSM